MMSRQLHWPMIRWSIILLLTLLVGIGAITGHSTLERIAALAQALWVLGCMLAPRGRNP